MKPTIASRMFDAENAKAELEDALDEAGVKYERMGSDPYDCSLELYDVPAEYRLPAEAQRVVHGAGFAKLFVNHVDKWETHYTFKSGDFVEHPGWRVSYPHKRGDQDGKIWVEVVVERWPQDWFQTGYCEVRPST